MANNMHAENMGNFAEIVLRRCQWQQELLTVFDASACLEPKSLETCQRMFSIVYRLECIIPHLMGVFVNIGAA